MNRTYVGIWQSYGDPTVVKRCIWGDYRLPFSFDFDIGDGEMGINPKYISPEWESYLQRIYTDIENLENGRPRSTYKNPWW